MAGDVEIRIRATDETGNVFEGTIRGLQGVGAAGTASTGGLAASAAGLDRVSNAAQRGIRLMTAYEVFQINLTQGARRVAEAEQRAAEATAEFGSDSAEASGAAADLAVAQENLAKTTQRANAMMFIMALEVIPVVIKGLTALRAGMAATGSFAAATAALIGGPVGLAVVLGSAAAALVAADFLFKEAAKGAEQFAGGVDASAVATRKFDEDMAEMRKGMKFGGELATEAAIASGGLALIEQRIAQVKRDIMSPAAFEMALSISSPEAQNILVERQKGLRAELQALEGRQRDILAPATEELERQNDLIAQQAKLYQQEMASAVASLGVNLRQLSPPDLRALGLSELAAASEHERELTRAALQTTPALLNQLNVTHRKGETTQELVESLGLTVEQETLLAAQGRLTTEGILSQEEAIRRRTAALKDASSGGGAGGGLSQPGGTRVERESQVRVASGAGWVDVFASQLPERMRDPGFARSVGLPGAESSADIWDKVAARRMAQDEQQRAFAKTASRMGYVQSGAGWVPMMAEGGLVRETGLAVVHKGETVVPAQVTPGAAGGLHVGSVVVHVHGNASRQDVAEGVLDGIRESYDQARLRARRS